MEILLFALFIVVIINQRFRITNLKNELQLTKENLLAVLREEKREYFVYKDSETIE